jgi:hypothetical protein
LIELIHTHTRRAKKTHFFTVAAFAARGFALKNPIPFSECVAVEPDLSVSDYIYIFPRGGRDYQPSHQPAGQAIESDKAGNKKRSPRKRPF